MLIYRELFILIKYLIMSNIFLKDYSFKVKRIIKKSDLWGIIAKFYKYLN